MAFDAELTKLPTKKPIPSYQEMVNYLNSNASPAPILWYEPPKAPISPPLTFQAKAVMGCPCAECVRLRGYVSPPSADKETDIALLKKARARIEQGWTQGVTINAQGVCSVGGLLFAIQGRDPYNGMSQLDEANAERLARYLPGIDNAGDLIRFNDVQGRQKWEVLRLFDVAIAQLENRPVEPARYPPERLPYLTRAFSNVMGL